MELHPAWPVALNHSSHLDSKVLCKLLQVNKRLQNLIMQQCRGQLPVLVRIRYAARVLAFGAWLSRHGQLMKYLRLDLNFYEQYTEELAVSHIALALEEAAAAAPLQLQAFHMPIIEASGALLRRLPAGNLIELSVWLPPSAAHQVQVLQAISTLTGLKQLFIDIDSSERRSAPDSGLVASALAQLTNLTSFNTEYAFQSCAELAHLPAQLQCVRLGIARGDDAFADHTRSVTQPLNLDHLTALTSLNLAPGMFEDNSFMVREFDILPASLKMLHVTDCVSFEPLLGLPQLHTLTLDRSKAPAEQLRQLSQLTALTNISLSYYDERREGGAFSAAAATAWAVLSGLQTLDISSHAELTPMSTTVAESLGKATALRSLNITAEYMTRHTALQLALAFKQLTNLESLKLVALLVYQLDGEVEAAEPPSAATVGLYSKLLFGPALARSIVSLPALRKLDVYNQPLGYGADSELAGATQLTRLSLNGCDLCSEMVCNILAHMSRLKHLCLYNNKHVCSDCIPSIVALTQLTRLELYDTSIVPGSISLPNLVEGDEDDDDDVILYSAAETASNNLFLQL